MPATRSETTLRTVVAAVEPAIRDTRSAPRSRRWRRRAWFCALVLIPAVGVASCLAPPVTPAAKPPTTSVLLQPLDFAIPLTGHWETARVVTVAATIEGLPVAVAEMAEEGRRVANGEPIAWIDPAELNRLVAAQELKVKQAQAQVQALRDELENQKLKAAQAVAQAQQALDLAQLDREKYLHGDYLVEVDSLKWAITVATRELEEAQQRLEHYRQFVKKGFGTPEQLRLKEIEISRAHYQVLQQKARLVVLEKYTRRRMESDLNVKVEQAEREVPRVKSATAATLAKAQNDLLLAELALQQEQAKLERLRGRVSQPTLTAPEAGIWRPATPAQGKEVIGRIHDARQVLVRGRVPEAKARRLRPGQTVQLRCHDADEAGVAAIVRQVQRPWEAGGGGEETDTLVTLHVPTPPPAELWSPGQPLDAVLVARTRPVPTVPAQAVTEQRGQSFVLVVSPEATERRWVELGERLADRVEVRAGLRPGEIILADAQSVP
jgi:multidrug resistance efflux pump